MTLLEKQKLFSILVRDLISAIHAMGYTCTLGDLFRDQRVHGKYGEKKSYSASKSLHKLKLAIDINLFDEDGTYITDGSHTAYQRIGRWWEHRNELCEWGGSGDRQDANHFSFSHEGRW